MHLMDSSSFLYIGWHLDYSFSFVAIGSIDLVMEHHYKRGEMDSINAWIKPGCEHLMYTH